MTVAEAKAAVRSYFEEVLNRGDMAAADAIFMPEVRFQYPLGDLNGVEAVKGYIAAVRTAFPDVRFMLEDVWRGRASGRSVAVGWQPDRRIPRQAADRKARYGLRQHHIPCSER